MRVLIVAHGHPAQSAGGAERAAYTLFRGLGEVPGIEACFLARTQPVKTQTASGPITDFPDRPHEFLFAAPESEPFFLTQPSAFHAEAFRQFVRRLKPDVIHFHHYLNIGIDLIASARTACPHARLFLTLHEYRVICHHHGMMVRADTGALCSAAAPDSCAACFPHLTPSRFALRRSHILAHLAMVDVFVAPSRFLRDRHVAWGLPSDRIIVCPNGIEPVLPDAERDGPVRRGRTVFGFFGQIHPFKGLLELLEAFQRPDARTLSSRLVIHGAYLELNDPAYVRRFRGLLAENRDRVVFHGAYDHVDQPKLLAAVDWVVVPSIWWENAPLVIEEALGQRRPILCSDIGGMAEKVRPTLDGFHFRTGSVDSLAALFGDLSAAPEIWDRLQTTLRAPSRAVDMVRTHVDSYRAS